MSDEESGEGVDPLELVRRDTILKISQRGRHHQLCDDAGDGRRGVSLTRRGGRAEAENKSLMGSRLHFYWWILITDDLFCLKGCVFSVHGV